MKRNVRKWLGLALALVMLCGLVGCNTPSEGDASATDSTTTTTDSTATSATTESTTASTTETSATTVSTTVSATASTATTKPTTVTTTTKPTAVTTASTTQSTTESTTTTTRPTTKPKGIWDKKTSEIGFGFYGVNFDKYGFDTKWKDLVKTDYVNTVFCDNPKSFPELKAYNCRVWVSVGEIYNKVRAGSAGWQEEFDELYQAIKDSGCEDIFLGWYIDEPNHMSAVKEITKYAYENYGKRFFICFMVNTVDPSLYGGFQGEDRHISKDTVQYITDIAADAYGEVNSAQGKRGYEKLFDALHKYMRPDAKVWYIPCTFTRYDILEQSSAEVNRRAQHCIDHTDYMYEFLENEPVENRGGIMAFAYDFDSPAEEIYSLWNVNNLMNNAWKKVMDNCISIGREICSGELDA